MVKGWKPPGNGNSYNNDNNYHGDKYRSPAMSQRTLTEIKDNWRFS
jgi:hypothetical protein